MKVIAAVALICLVAGAAQAVPEPLQPAPVPGIGDGHVAPADRAGDFNSNSVAAPFSAAPTNEIVGQGQATQQNEQGTVRQSAPTPNLSK